MTINASLTGRLRNISLPKSNALSPLFEAVVNAIQAIDELDVDMELAYIEVTILRDQQQPFGAAEDSQDTAYAEPIRGFIVSDNGEGFHDRNMESFRTLDSEYRSAYGCRGVGRLLWLKAFKRVEVVGHYLDAEKVMKERQFVFAVQAAEVSEESGRHQEVRSSSLRLAQKGDSRPLG